MSDGSTGQWKPEDFFNQQKMLAFMIRQLLSGAGTCCGVQVIACSNSGGLVGSGTVTVQPLINQMTGDKKPVPHGQLYSVPYCRIQGGANAFIIDPQAGDVGLVFFTSRDNTAIRTAALGQGLAAGAKPMNPATFRQYDWSDGWYVGGFCNGVPTQYIMFNGQKISMLALTEIDITAPTVKITASTEFNVVSPDSEFTGTVHTTGTVAADTEVQQGTGGTAVHLSTHKHGGVTTGTGESAVPVPGT